MVILIKVLSEISFIKHLRAHKKMMGIIICCRERQRSTRQESSSLVSDTSLPRLPLWKMGTSLRQIPSVFGGRGGGGEDEEKLLQRGSCQREGQAGVRGVPGACAGALGHERCHCHVL